METGPVVWTNVKYGTADSVQRLVGECLPEEFSLPGGPNHTSPLHEAILNKNLAMIDVLCRIGVDMSYTARSGPAAGLTPYELVLRMRTHGGVMLDIYRKIEWEWRHRVARAAQRAYVAEMWANREDRRRLSFVMGSHFRLGADSRLSNLDPEILRLILGERRRPFSYTYT
jgi:hypothetical protein